MGKGHKEGCSEGQSVIEVGRHWYGDSRDDLLTKRICDLDRL